MAKISAERKWFIYLLIDPRDGGVRYVGWTTNPIYRLRSHVSCARCGRENTYKSHWIKQIIESGLRLRMDVVESGIGNSSWQEAEERWINHYKSLGANLTNATAGGEGAMGMSQSPESNAKRSASLKNRIFTEDHKSRISAAKKGVTSPAIKEQAKRLHDARRGSVRPAEEVEKRAAALRGRKRTIEVILKTAEKNKGKKRTPEQRARMSAASARPMLGVKWSEETRRRFMESIKGRQISLETRLKISNSLKSRAVSGELS